VDKRDDKAHNLRIGFIAAFFTPKAGGSAVSPYMSAKYLARGGHEVLVFTSDFGRNMAKFQHEDEIRVIESAVKINFFGLLYTPDFRDKLEKYYNEIEILHLHNFRTYQNVMAHKFAKRHKIPYILQAHGSLPRIGKRPLKYAYDLVFGHRILKNASKVIALTEFEAEQYRTMGISEEKIAIIPNGIDLSEYANLPPKRQFKKKFNIPEDKRIALYLGRIHKIKGIDLLVKAYAYLTKKMNFKDVVLVIAGPDDGYLSEVKSLVQSLGVSSSVLFTGPLYGRDKLEAYVDSDVYVLPSRYETFPTGLLEAYACGKPVIASNVGGLKELVINGETGLLFEAGNVEQLADRLLYLLNHDEESKDMGKKARRFVEERYSIEKVITKLEKVYEEIAIR